MKNLRRVVKLHVMGTVCLPFSVTHLISSCEQHAVIISIAVSIT